MPMMESENHLAMEPGETSLTRGLATRIRKSFMGRKKKNQAKREGRDNLQPIEGTSKGPRKPLTRSTSLEKLPKRKDSSLASPSIPKKKQNQNRKISLPFAPLAHNRKTSAQPPTPETPSSLEVELANQENQSPNDLHFQRKVSRQWQENMLLSQTRRFCPQQTAALDATKNQLFHALQKQANFHWPSSPSQQSAFQRQVSGTPQTFDDSPMLSPSPFLTPNPFRRNVVQYSSMPSHRVAFQELSAFQRGIPNRSSSRNSSFQNRSRPSSPFQNSSRSSSPFRSTSRGLSSFRSGSRASSPTPTFSHTPTALLTPSSSLTPTPSLTPSTSPFMRRTNLSSSVKEPRVRKQARHQLSVPEVNIGEVIERTRKISLNLPSPSAVSTPSPTRKVSFNFHRDKGKEGKTRGKRIRPLSIDDTIVVKIQQAVKREQFAAETMDRAYVPADPSSLGSTSPQVRLRRLSLMIRRSMKKHRRSSNQTPPSSPHDPPTIPKKQVAHRTPSITLTPPPPPTPSPSVSSEVWYDNYFCPSSPTPSMSASLSPSSATSSYSFSSLFDTPSSSDPSSWSTTSISTSSSSSTFQDIFVTQPEIAEKFAIMFPSEPRPEWHRHLRSMLHKAGQKIFRKQSEAHDTTIPEDLRYQLKQIYVY
ncbi:uncharacterized protein LOC143028142 isoform X1 [Oratosquilla oratoria]|uniref:uncharacterized protein LOC143028142 isoform X1 n=1 Tax=Oratosquilla oratoria TaxID=337810 RepID=UPI003F765536